MADFPTFPAALDPRGSAANAVIVGLTILIRDTLAAHEGERSRPSMTPDAMDFYIGETGARVKKLRQLREDFENEMSLSMHERP